MSKSVFPLRVRGRLLTAAEFSQIARIIKDHPDLSRKALSVRVCEAMNWFQPNGRPKDRACRDILLQLHRRELIQLPEPRVRWTFKRNPIVPSEKTDPLAEREWSLSELGDIVFETVTGKSRRGERLWNEYVDRYHFLGYRIVVGPSIKYFLRTTDQMLGCLAFGGAAWKVGARDRWIGWSAEQREAGLPRIVNNTRFLILPWIRCPNLASHILGRAAKIVGRDWRRTYGIVPLLMETFVHADRHRGTCYRAANWIEVGQTQGRGRMDRYNKADLPRKRVFVQPLVRSARDLLKEPCAPLSH